ncbi:MAG: glycosyltransferase family 87 protein [Gemmatimonadaceae bacterium]
MAIAQDPTARPHARRDRVAAALVRAAWIVAVAVVTVQGIVRPRNNFLIFRGAWDHLVHRQNLYAPGPGYQDLFKYSPSFAFLFAPFAVVPLGLGYLLWTALNAGLLYVAIGRLLPPRQALVVRAVVFFDMLGSLQNAQSNALVTALIVLAFTELARRRQFAAAVSVAVGTAVKIFPIAAGVFLVFHPRRARFVGLCVLAGAAVALAPLLVVPARTLAAQYQGWRAVESHDAPDRMFSIMQQLHLWLHVDWPNWPQQLAGVAILMLPLAARRDRLVDPTFQRLFLASLLIFCVLFNHQAESPTFVVALCGVGIWFASTPATTWNRALLAFVLLGTTAVNSSLMPATLRREFFAPYYFKTIPIFVVWIALQVLLLRSGSEHAEVPERDVAAGEAGA